MHTTEFRDGITVHHDGDYSGELHIIVPHKRATPGVEYVTFQLPFEVCKELVAECIRMERMSKLENMDPNEILGL